MLKSNLKKKIVKVSIAVTTCFVAFLLTTVFATNCSFDSQIDELSAVGKTSSEIVQEQMRTGNLDIEDLSPIALPIVDGNQKQVLTDNLEQKVENQKTADENSPYSNMQGPVIVNAEGSSIEELWYLYEKRMNKWIPIENLQKDSSGNVVIHEIVAETQ